MKESELSRTPMTLQISSMLLEMLKKLCSQAGQKGLRCEAREKSTSGGVLKQYVGARRSSATKQMGLFQQSVEGLIPAPLTYVG